MLFQPGPLVSSVAGSISGTTFQRSPHGLMARKRPIPTTRYTPSVTAAKQRISSALALWRSLPQSERDDWQTWAALQPWSNRFGDPMVLTGYNAFMIVNGGSWNTPAGDFTQALIHTVPTDTVSVLPANLTVTFDTMARTVVLDSTDATVDADTQIVVFASKVRKPRRCRLAQGQDADPTIGRRPPGGAFPWDISAALAAVTGNPAALPAGAGQFIFVRAYNQASRWPGVTIALPLDY